MNCIILLLTHTNGVNPEQGVQEKDMQIRYSCIRHTKASYVAV